MADQILGRVVDVPKRICSFPDCEEIHYAKGYCLKHYKRWRKHGDPAVLRQVPNGTPPEVRFWPRVNKTETCWLWTGEKGKLGYGWFYLGLRQRKVKAHRFAYNLLVGPIPSGLELDHVKANGCTSTLCVKAIADEHGPAHLEPVTHAENTRRGDGGVISGARNRAKTHCRYGHPYSGENLYVYPNGERGCRACHRRTNRESARRRAEREGRARVDWRRI